MTLALLQLTAENTTKGGMDGCNREEDEGAIKSNLGHQRKDLLKAGRMEMM